MNPPKSKPIDSINDFYESFDRNENLQKIEDTSEEDFNPIVADSISQEHENIKMDSSKTSNQN